MPEEVINGEIVDEETTGKRDAVALRNPEVPATINQLAMLRSEALEVIEARVKVLEALRKAAIRATSPEDWILYRDDKGNTIGFLQDCGCDRVRDLYGIEIFDISVPERKEMEGGFMYLISGSGRCTIGQQTVEGIEGGRASTDDFCKSKKGVELELNVRKAARANLDGNITRELSGLKSVPLQDLEAAWAGTNKSSDRCRKGRGFGSGAERMGADMQTGAGVAQSEAPTCKKCGKSMRFKQGKPGVYESFWSCPTGKEGCNFTIKESVWKQQPQQAAPAAPAAQPQQAAQAATPAPSREPGGDDEPPPPSDNENPERGRFANMGGVTKDDIPFGGGRR